jgi:inner membrane protein
MDIVTHALLGSAIAEAGFREKLGARALVAGAVLAVLPDFDVVVRLQGPWEVLKYHRGPTHSLIVIALVSPLIGWLLWLWTRKHARPARGGPAPETQGHRISPWNWILLAFAAFVQNPLLDLCTSYGTQLLWPLTTRRFAIDAVAIIDPLYTLPLLAAFLIACIPGIRRLTRTFAACVLVLTTGYLAFGFLQMERARSLASAQLAREGFPAVVVRATPTPLTNNLLWRITASDDRRNLRVGLVSTWEPREIRFIALDWLESPLVEKALRSENGRVFNWFADGLVSAHVEPQPGGTAVILEDQRSGNVTDLTRSFFVAEALFNSSGQLTGVNLHRRGLDLRRELAAAWKLLRGEETTPP